MPLTNKFSAFATFEVKKKKRAPSNSIVKMKKNIMIDGGLDLMSVSVDDLKCYLRRKTDPPTFSGTEAIACSVLD